MNERINELAKQCWIQEACDFDMHEGGLSTIRPVFDRKKFAELIIQECADICFDRDYATGDRYGEEIVKYFGVEQ